MPSKIEWCDETLNPQGWGCYGPGGTPEAPQRCWYCYVERQAKGPYVPDCELCRKLIPHWHPERLEQPLRWRKPRRIFWQSMGDLFHPFSPQNQILAVQDMAKATPQHIHIFCTKNPIRYQDFNLWPGNCWLLTTVENQKAGLERIPLMWNARASVRGVSFEPLMGEIDTGFAGAYIDWFIIGAYTGKGASRFVPATAWVQSLIDQGRAAGVPIFLKDNLKWPSIIQEWPGRAV